jgi:hypothetical protein
MNETGKGFSVPLGDINFGAVAPVEEKLSFYNELNGSMVELVRSLPPSVHTGAMLSLMRYSRLSPGEPLDFFRRYPAPSWSVIFHVSSAGKQRLSAVEAARRCRPRPWPCSSIRWMTTWWTANWIRIMFFSF